MKSRRVFLRWAACASLSAAAGCHLPGSDRGRHDRIRAQVERQAALSFERAVLDKPRPSGAEDLSSKLAPLFVRQVRTALDHKWDPGSEPPAVWGGDDQVQTRAGGGRYCQLTYAWDEEPSRSGGIRGIRMILNSAGAPVIWEPLESARTGHRIFVAESLEQAAVAEFGAPLPGRRYSIEAGRNGGVTVARLLSDGPIPMGPVIYVEARAGSITTILCRCMPAQVKEVIATREYFLRPLAEWVDKRPRFELTPLAGSLRLPNRW